MHEADAPFEEVDRAALVVLGRAEGEKASVLVAVTKDLTKRAPAGKLVRELGKMIGGGGGGRPEMAEAGGRDPSRLDHALESALDLAQEGGAGPSLDGLALALSYELRF